MDSWDFSLHWRHNGSHGVSNHQPQNCLLNRLFRRRSKKLSKPSVTGLCVGNSPVTGEFPTQRASNTENVSIWWRHHAIPYIPENMHTVFFCSRFWFFILPTLNGFKRFLCPHSSELTSLGQSYDWNMSVTHQIAHFMTFKLRSRTLLSAEVHDSGDIVSIASRGIA